MSCFAGVLLVAILSALCFPSSMLAQCTLPAAPSTGVPASTFDALVTQNGPGWTGGDGTYSTVLPDGRVLWGWSDSSIGTVDPITRLRQSYYPTAHNSLTIQNTSNNTLTTVGYPPNTGSYFVPQITSNECWMGDAVVVQPSPGVYKVKIMLLEFAPGIHFEGNAVATLSWPSLSIDSIVPVSLPDLTISGEPKSCTTDPLTTFTASRIRARQTSFRILLASATSTTSQIRPSGSTGTRPAIAG